MQAKCSLIATLKDMDLLPSAMTASRRTLKRDKEQLAATKTPYGRLLQNHSFATEDGATTIVPFQNPLAMLYVATQTSEAYTQYVRDAIEIHGKPSAQSPWGIVVYFDEVTCGNPFAQGNKRKVQGVYWSVYELGMQALSDELCWFEVVAIQQERVHTLKGGMTYVVEQVLLSFFNDEGFDLRTGLAFDILGYGPLMMVMNLDFIIADIKALVEAVGSLGPTAMLPCFLCDHVVSYVSKSKPPLKDNDAFVTLSCLDHSKMGKRSSANIRQTLQTMATKRAQVDANTLTKTEADASQTYNGYKHIPNNFLLNQSLAIDAA